MQDYLEQIVMFKGTHNPSLNKILLNVKNKKGIVTTQQEHKLLPVLILLQFP